MRSRLLRPHPLERRQSRFHLLLSNRRRSNALEALPRLPWQRGRSLQLNRVRRLHPQSPHSGQVQRIQQSQRRRRWFRPYLNQP